MEPGGTSLLNEAFNEAALRLYVMPKQLCALLCSALVQLRLRLWPTATPRTSDSVASQRQNRMELGKERDTGMTTNEGNGKSGRGTENETETARNLTRLAGIISILWNRIYITTMSGNSTTRKIPGTLIRHECR